MPLCKKTEAFRTKSHQDCIMLIRSPHCSGREKLQIGMSRLFGGAETELPWLGFNHFDHMAVYHLEIDELNLQYCALHPRGHRRISDHLSMFTIDLTLARRWSLAHLLDRDTCRSQPVSIFQRPVEPRFAQAVCQAALNTWEDVRGRRLLF